MLFLIKGILVGFLIAIPSGPVGFICVRRTLVYGPLSGLLSGLGTVSGDILYSIVVTFGLHFISKIILHHELPLRILGTLAAFAMHRFFLRTPNTIRVRAGRHFLPRSREIRSKRKPICRLVFRVPKSFVRTVVRTWDMSLMMAQKS